MISMQNPHFIYLWLQITPRVILGIGTFDTPKNSETRLNSFALEIRTSTFSIGFFLFFSSLVNFSFTFHFGFFQFRFLTDNIVEEPFRGKKNWKCYGLLMYLYAYSIILWAQIFALTLLDAFYLCILPLFSISSSWAMSVL